MIYLSRKLTTKPTQSQWREAIGPLGLTPLKFFQKQKKIKL